jgi:hypothetical protein
MIDATTHTRKIWRSHFDGADSTFPYSLNCLTELHSSFFLGRSKLDICNSILLPAIKLKKTARKNYSSYGLALYSDARLSPVLLQYLRDDDAFRTTDMGPTQNDRRLEAEESVAATPGITTRWLVIQKNV